jgi:hypothetical protein
MALLPSCHDLARLASGASMSPSKVSSTSGSTAIGGDNNAPAVNVTTGDSSAVSINIDQRVALELPSYLGKCWINRYAAMQCNVPHSPRDARRSSSLVNECIGDLSHIEKTSRLDHFAISSEKSMYGANYRPPSWSWRASAFLGVGLIDSIL